MVENNIKMELKEIRCEVGCIHLAQDGDYWAAVVNAVMNVWVPWKTLHFLNQLWDYQLLKENPLHEVRYQQRHCHLECRDNAVGTPVSYRGGPGFAFRTGIPLYWSHVSVILFRPSSPNPRFVCMKVGQGRFLSHAFHFTSHPAIPLQL
jgi:hypothetical protein